MGLLGWMYWISNSLQNDFNFSAINSEPLSILIFSGFPRHSMSCSSTKTGKRNRKFAEKITIRNNEVIDHYGKFIVWINRAILFIQPFGKIMKVIGKTQKKMIESKILPPLK